MLDSLYIGATGMQAQQAHVDTIANNLANVNTPGFKKSRVGFAELVVAVPQLAPSIGGTEGGALAEGARGAGVQLAATDRLFDAGDMKKTDSPLDVAIVGDGFLEAALADGSRAYVRGGSLRVNAEGQLATQSGLALKPGINVPEKAESIAIHGSGRIEVRVSGQASPVDVGQLELVRFANPQSLQALGGGMYRATEASGEPIAGRAGEDGMGTVVQGMLEASNVKLVDEMVNLMVAQRAYEASVKVVQAADDMLGMINGLRR